MITESFAISGIETDQSHLYNTYNLEHHSDVGTKYVSTNDKIKITHSDKIINYVQGSWRMALNESPFTSYYVNPSRSEELPVSGWVDINDNEFTGVFNTTLTPVVSSSLTPSVSITPTPTPTPTPSPSIPVTTPPVQIFAPTIQDSGDGMYSNDLTETVVVYGRPTITFLSHNNILMGSKYAVLVTGYSMQYTTNTYLSSNVDMFEHKLIDTHNDSEYPPISACETSFDIISENEIIVNIPAVSKTGMIDIIISNPAGYGKLTPVYEPISTAWTEENLQPYVITVDL